MNIRSKFKKCLHKTPVFLAASLLVAACATVDVTKTSSGFHDPTDPNSVEILKTRPIRSFEELGVVTAVGFASTDTAKMHNAIRAKSAALGANAVILTEEGLCQKDSVPTSVGATASPFFTRQPLNEGEPFHSVYLHTHDQLRI
jgi:hypothetical protein